MSHFLSSQSTSTTMTPDYRLGFLIRVRRDSKWFIVEDFIGTRYGHGETVDAALAEYMAQVNDLLGLDLEELADPILTETKAYRQAFHTEPHRGDS